jgi:hypothetical protein
MVASITRVQSSLNLSLAPHFTKLCVRLEQLSNYYYSYVIIT